MAVDAQIGMVVIMYRIDILRTSKNRWCWDVMQDLRLVDIGTARTQRAARRTALRAARRDYICRRIPERYTFDPKSDDGLVER